MEKKEKGKSGLAIGALVLGILAIGGSFIPIINNASIILGIIGGILALIALIKKKSIGMSIVGLILCALAVIISFALQDSWVKSIDEINETIEDIDGSNTEKILKNDVDVKIGNLVVKKDDIGLVDTYVLVTVTNKAKEKTSYSIQIEAVDSTGKRIEDDTVYANDLGPGQTQDFKIFEYIEDDKLNAMKSATFKVVEVSK